LGGSDIFIAASSLKLCQADLRHVKRRLRCRDVVIAPACLELRKARLRNVKRRLGRGHVFVTTTGLKLCKARARHVDRDAGLVQACVEFLRARTDQLGISKRGTSAVELCLGDVPRRLGGT
jgi:hypothetical protein